ncbi:Aste57867_10773 [Aphanomyces stellatus]|uniref:Aste57867_10773 protein n=1 Tax=Aphanomyces stellatus TaxID=120398 RepID=A0A485KSE0_9STRA|nr:hypothetical protein As57867_010733 [Aphanomyces stellatus]VFT87643.1 Aste57867_10773 [Aphanomyces stellatus]
MRTLPPSSWRRLLALLSLPILLFLIWPFLHPRRSFPPLHGVPLDRVRALWTDDDFECLAWRAVDGCDPVASPRLPAQDLGCNATIKQGMAGYCELRNQTSGEIFRVMASGCKSVQAGVTYTCSMARTFTDFSILASASSADDAPPLPLALDGSRGIVLSIYDRSLPSVYAIVHLLRRRHGCTLPIELFYMAEDTTLSSPILAALQTKFGVELREITSPQGRFETKPYAVFHSRFDQVLFLDCDNLPTRDPSYLFDSPAYLESGAVFWPDFWTPATSIFDLHAQSLVWQLLDMAPPRGGFEQESGQLVIDRRRATRALPRLLFYNRHLGSASIMGTLRFLHGDKDMWRLAWRNTSTPFTMVATPPALAGLYDGWLFCGLAMLQHDPDMSNRIAFVHSNAVKLTGDVHQTPVLTHVQTFARDADLDWYILRNEGKALFDTPSCWALNWQSPATITSVDKTAVGDLELEALRLAYEATRLGGLDPSRHDRPNLSTVAWFHATMGSWFWSTVVVVVVGSVTLVTKITLSRRKRVKRVAP